MLRHDVKFVQMGFCVEDRREGEANGAIITRHGDPQPSMIHTFPQGFGRGQNLHHRIEKIIGREACACLTLDVRQSRQIIGASESNGIAIR
jgi:hypothetical protein